MRPVMRRSLTLAVLALGAPLPALAQDGWALDARLTLAGSAINDKTPLAPAGDAVLASGALAVKRTDTFDGGLQLVWRGEVKLERDAASRPAFAGVLGDCPASNALCPRVASGAGFLSPISPATGLAATGGILNEDGFATLEGASLAVSGAWGEGVLGLDSGAATQLDAQAPTVLQRVSALSPGLDPTGLVIARARNDVTGSSFKATYLSPRWIGFRAGISYTPEANQRGADFDPDVHAGGLASPELESVFEGALSFARRFPESGLRVRTALTYSKADSRSPLPGFGNYEAWGAGLELEQGEWTGGVRWLSSNNAWDSGNRDYEAWEAGLVRQGSEWRFGVETGWAKDKLTGIDGQSWLVGASRKVTQNIDVGLAWTSAEADLSVPMGLSLGHTNARNTGVVLELAVRN
jgi:Gram-negative porin